MAEKVWMKDPHGGEPREVDATAELIVPLMVSGWTQCEPPVRAADEEVDDDAS